MKGATVKIIFGDAKEVLKEYRDQVHLIITSPPYADARKVHYDGVPPDRFPQWFMEFNDSFAGSLVNNGNFVLNIKDRVMNGTRNHYVWTLVNLLENKGWKPIDDYIWHKPNPMPGFWPTRLRDGWEYCFHLSKTIRPYTNQDAIKVPIGEWAEPRLAKLNGKSAERHNSENNSGFGRDLRKWVGKDLVSPTNVLSIPVVGSNRQHPAVFPIGLPEFFIKLLCPEDGLVVDPFGGSGTTGEAALKLNRNCLIIDNNKKYCEVAFQNIKKAAKLDQEVIKINF